MGLERWAKAGQCVKILIVPGCLFFFFFSPQPPGSCQGRTINNVPVEEYGHKAQGNPVTSLGKGGRGHDPGAGSEEREAGGCENTVEGEPMGFGS